LTKKSGDEGVIGQGKRIISEITSHEVYTTSFSERGNLLSQWRAYSGLSSGYSIGFSSGYLKAIGANFIKNFPGRYYSPGNPLVPCQYFDVVVEKQLKEKIQNAVDLYIAKAEEIERTLPYTERIGCNTPAGIALNHFREFSRECAITKR